MPSSARPPDERGRAARRARERRPDAARRRRAPGRVPLGRRRLERGGGAGQRGRSRRRAHLHHRLRRGRLRRDAATPSRWPTPSRAATPASCSPSRLPGAAPRRLRGHRPAHLRRHQHLLRQPRRPRRRHDRGPGRHRRRRALRRLPELRGHPRMLCAPAPGCRSRRADGPGGAPATAPSTLGARLASGLPGTSSRWRRRRRAGASSPTWPAPPTTRSASTRSPTPSSPGRPRPSSPAAPSGRRSGSSTTACPPTSPRPGASASRAASCGTRSRCWSCPASSASACCATPTPPAWPSPSRCGCRCSTTSSPRRPPASTRPPLLAPGQEAAPARRRPGQARSRHLRPPQVRLRPAHRHLGAAAPAAADGGTSSPTPSSPPASACAARPCRPCGAPSPTGGRACTGRASGPSTCCCRGAETHDCRLRRMTSAARPQPQGALPVRAADPPHPLGREPPQLRPGERARAPRPRRVRVLPGRAASRTTWRGAPPRPRPGRRASRSTSTAGRSGFLAQYGSYALALPPLWITAYLRAAAASPREALLPRLLRERLAWCDVVVADFPFVHPIFARPSARGRLRVLSTHNVEHRALRRPAPLAGRLVRAAVRRIELRGGPGLRHPRGLLRRRPEFFEAHARVRQSVLVPNGIDLRRFRGHRGQPRPHAAGAGHRGRRAGVPVHGQQVGPQPRGLRGSWRFAEGNARLLAERRIHILVVGSVTAEPSGGRASPRPARSTVVEPYFAAADAALNPLSSGAGTNVKMCEFIALRLPVGDHAAWARAASASRTGQTASSSTGMAWRRCCRGCAGSSTRIPARLRRMAEDAYAAQRGRHRHGRLRETSGVRAYRWRSSPWSRAGWLSPRAVIDGWPYWERSWAVGWASGWAVYLRRTEPSAPCSSHTRCMRTPCTSPGIRGYR